MSQEIVVHATVQDLEARWRTLDSSEQARATTLLKDASAIINEALASVGRTHEDVNPQILSMLTCKIVKRAMATELDGISTTQMTAGPFNQSMTFVNPTGDLYLTKGEEKMLGLHRQRISTIHPMIRGIDD